MFDDLKNKLLTIPQRIKDEQLKLLDINKTVERINNDKKRLTRKISAQVYNETTSDGKKAFTNEAIRETETNARLEMMPDFIQFIDEESRESQNAKLANIEIEFLEREFKSVQFIVKLLEVER